MKRVFNLLVVDESGSMSIIEHQALVGINETLTTIQRMQKTHKDMEQRVTLHHLRQHPQEAVFMIMCLPAMPIP